MIVVYRDQRLSLRPYTYCWSDLDAAADSSTGCIDGVPPDPLPDLGPVAGAITVTFPRDGWSFDASSQAGDGDCGEALPATVTRVDEGMWRITLAGRPGRYAVHLFGKGPGGDVAASFAVRTTVAGSQPAPVASLTTFFERNGHPDAYSFDLAVTYLASAPSRASARLTVTSADGRRSSYRLTSSRGADAGDGCVARGSVALSAPAPPGRVVEQIGRPPYALRVELDLDGMRYVAAATWPDDVETSSSISLHFTPPLPARS